MNENLRDYYLKIDKLIINLSNLSEMLFDEISKGESCDGKKISNLQNHLKIIAGPRSPCEVLASLVKTQAKLAELIPEEAQKDALTIDEIHFQTAYNYFIERYEREELYRSRFCKNCGEEQHFWDHLVGDRKHLSFRDYIQKISNGIL